MEWCMSIPKVELHAHLNGSIRDSTLLYVSNLLLFRPRAKGLGDKGLIDFSQVQHVILKSMYFPSILTLLPFLLQYITRLLQI
jgi:adenosine deaminase